MGVQQLMNFAGQLNQRGFWVFTYANLGGGFCGGYLGYQLAAWLLQAYPAYSIFGVAGGAALGVACTWNVKGKSVYGWVLAYLGFLTRRYLKLGLDGCVAEPSAYYGRHIVQSPSFTLLDRVGNPVLVHRGGASSKGVSDLFVQPTADALAVQETERSRSP